MSTSLTIGIIFAIASVVCVLLDPLWLRVGGGYWRFTPMLRRLRLRRGCATASTWNNC